MSKWLPLITAAAALIFVVALNIGFRMGRKSREEDAN